MRRIITIIPLLALVTLGNVASADSFRGAHRPAVSPGGAHVPYRHGRAVGRHRDSRYVQPRHVHPRYARSRWVHGGYSWQVPRVVRRPIYVPRPVITHRYVNYYQRPAILVENYPPRAGYLWVPGHWHWNGYEWLWQPGHYQPDAAYGGYGHGYGYGHGSGYGDGAYGPPPAPHVDGYTY